MDKLINAKCNQWHCSLTSWSRIFENDHFVNNKIVTLMLCSFIFSDYLSGNNIAENNKFDNSLIVSLFVKNTQFF